MIRWGQQGGRQRWVCRHLARRRCVAYQRNSDRYKAKRRARYAAMSEERYAHFRQVNLAARRRRADRLDAGGIHA